MLIPINSKCDSPELRLQDFMEAMPKGYISIFRMRNWKEPWAFGRVNGPEAGKLYKEATVTLGIADEDDFDYDWTLDCEDSDLIVIVLREESKMGIIDISSAEGESFEVIENLMNRLIKQITIPSKVHEKQKDNVFDIPKMSLFK